MQIRKLFLLMLLFGVMTSVSAQKYSNKSNSELKTDWEGSSFSSTKTLADNIAGLEVFSDLYGILKNESLKKSLSEEEMVTIFAPTNAAFTNLSEEKRKALMLDKTLQTSIIKFLAVPGRLDMASIKVAIRQGDGFAYFKTLSGEKLGAKLVDGKVVLFDSENNTAMISATDFYHKNGLFHIVDDLVYPTTNPKK